MLSALRRTLQAHGFRATALGALRSLLDQFLELRTDLVLIKPLAATPTEAPGAIQAEVIDAPSLEWFATLPSAWQTNAEIVKTFRTYIANRFSCTLVKEYDIPIGYFWWTNRAGGIHGAHPHVTRLGLTLADDDAWIFDLHVSPEHRRKGKAAACIRLAEAEGHRRGFRRALFYVGTHNLPARALYRHLGWEVESMERSIVICRSLLIGGHGIFLHAGWRRPYGFDYAPLLRWAPRRAVISSVARAESRS